MTASSAARSVALAWMLFLVLGGTTPLDSTPHSEPKAPTSSLSSPSSLTSDNGAPIVATRTKPAKVKRAGPATGVPMAGPPPGKKAKRPTGLMRLKGDYLEFGHKKRSVVIKGSAYIEQDDIKLWAENIQGDLARSQIYAHGKVVFWQGSERLSGDFLTYNYKTRKGRISNLKTWRGPNLVKARVLEIEPYKMTARDVRTTSCDHTPPHYEITASEMVMYPRDRMILKRATLRVNGRAWLRFPKYTVNLKDPQRVSRLYISPGFSSRKGFYAKTSYSFYFGRSAYGRIHAKPSQKAGNEAGVDLRYELGKRSSGVFQANRFNSNLIGQTQDMVSLAHKARLSKKTNLQVNATYTGTTFTGAAKDEEARLNATATTSFGDWNATATIDRRIDVDKDEYLLDNNISYLNLSPRFLFQQKSARRLLGTNLRARLETSYARIEEKTLGTVIKSGRKEIKADFTPPALKLPGLSPITWNFRESHIRYDTIDQQTFNLNANTTVRHTKALSTSFNYVWQNVRGGSPFTTYDRLADGNLLTGYLRAQNAQLFRATLFQTSYDLLNGRFTAASSNFNFMAPPSSRYAWSFGISPIYNLGTDPNKLHGLRLGNLSGNFRIAHRKNTWRHSFITNYDTRNRRLASVSSAHDFPLGETVKFMANANLGRDVLQNNMQLTRLSVGFVKDLHAWEARLRWDVKQKEAFIEIYLKHASRKKFTVEVDYEGGLSVDPTLTERQIGPTFAAP